MWSRLAAIVVLLPLAASCGPSGPPGSPRGAVLVLLDTLRADRTSLHGHWRPTTPNLERLASRGVVFENAVSPSPWTLPAVAALLSGRTPALDLFDAGRLRASLVEELSDAGFTTAAITEGGYLSRSFGLERGFSLFLEHRVEAVVRGATPAAGIERTFDEALRWLEEHGDERFFLLIHSYEPHMPYTRGRFTEGLGPSEFGEAYDLTDLRRIRAGTLSFGEEQRAYLEALYDGGVAVADAYVGRLLAFLEEAGLDEHTLVVVTSDHGEDLGDRVRKRAGSHGHSLYDELLRVPLVIRDPTSRFAERRVAAQVRSVDVLPTVLDLLGVPVPTGLEGASLVPFMQGREDADRVVVAASVRDGPRRLAVRAGSLKLIGDVVPGEESGFELYDLTADPGERDDLAGAEAVRVEPLRGRLEQWRRTLEARGGDDIEPVIEAEARRQLEALGYLERATETPAAADMTGTEK